MTIESTQAVEQGSFTVTIVAGYCGDFADWELHFRNVEGKVTVFVFVAEVLEGEKTG